jgi:branched-subunit amino acid aminotransferase/4-amino-4-deoxychorismate lyase
LKATEEALQRIKEHKARMEDECDKLCKRLNENKEGLK